MSLFCILKWKNLIAPLEILYSIFCHGGDSVNWYGYWLACLLQLYKLCWLQLLPQLNDIITRLKIFGKFAHRKRVDGRLGGIYVTSFLGNQFRLQQLGCCWAKLFKAEEKPNVNWILSPLRNLPFTSCESFTSCPLKNSSLFPYFSSLFLIKWFAWKSTSVHLASNRLPSYPSCKSRTLRTPVHAYSTTDHVQMHKTYPYYKFIAMKMSQRNLPCLSLCR